MISFVGINAPDEAAYSESLLGCWVPQDTLWWECGFDELMKLEVNVLLKAEGWWSQILRSITQFQYYPFIGLDSGVQNEEIHPVFLSAS